MLRLNALAVVACMLGGCAQMPPSGSAAIPDPVIIDRFGITRTLPVRSAKACSTRELVAERSSGRPLLTGCADEHDSPRTAEHHNEIVRDDKLLTLARAGSRRPSRQPGTAESETLASVRATDAAAFQR